MTTYLDFYKLKGRAFELLVADLLTQQGFKEVKSLHGSADTAIDIVAEYTHSDEQGKQTTGILLVECKLYHSDRASVGTIQQLSHYVSNNATNSKGLLITNSQLTAAANRTLMEARRQGQKEIQVIEGTELKRMLLQHEGLINKYFVEQ